MLCGHTANNIDYEVKEERMRHGDFDRDIARAKLRVHRKRPHVRMIAVPHGWPALETPLLGDV